MNELTNAEEYDQVVRENMDGILKEERELAERYAEARS